MFLAAFAWRYAAHHLRAVIDRRLCVKAGLSTGETLHQKARVVVDEYAHCASLTTFSAASFMPSATVKLNPDSFRISRPFPTLVPSMRTTIGTLIFSSRAAFTTPVASVSQRRIPPKMLMRTAFTWTSERR